MEIGIVLSGRMAPSRVVALAQLAEVRGLASFWVTEGAGGDAFALLAAAGAATSRIRLGSAVVNVYSRSASLIAMAAATVDELSRGRFTLGLGTSHVEQIEGEHGLRREMPMQRLKDTVEVARLLHSKQAVAGLQLRTVSIRSFALTFQALRQRMPIYLAAVRPQMIELAMAIADGAILTWRTPAEVSVLGLGRPIGWSLASLVHCGVGDDRGACATALEVARQRHSRFANYRTLFEGQETHAGICCAQSADLAAGLSAYKAAGLDEALLLAEAAPGMDAEAAVRRLIEMLPEQVAEVR